MSTTLPAGSASRGWRLVDRAVLAGVFIAMWLPAGLMAAGVHARQIENRPLASVPDLTTTGLADGSWFKGVDAFIADNVAVRWVAVRLRGTAYLLARSTGSAAVVLGRDGWLFPRNGLDPRCTHGPADIAAALAHAEGLAARNIAFRLVALPDKQTIYPSEVGTTPFGAPCTDVRRSELRAALASHPSIALDGWALLGGVAPGAGARLLYYPHDTHWTPLGAVPVIRALVRSLDPAAWSDVDVIERGTTRHAGDLARQIGVTRVDRVVNVVVRPDVVVARSDIALPFKLRNEPTVFRTTTSTTRNVIEGRTLIVYDSFFGTEVSLIAPAFREAVWVHIGDLQEHPEIATMTGPFRTVIVERVERFLYLDDLDAVIAAISR